MPGAFEVTCLFRLACTVAHERVKSMRGMLSTCSIRERRHSSQHSDSRSIVSFWKPQSSLPR